MTTIQEFRIDFERKTNRSISMPLAGAIVWLIIGIVSFIIPFSQAI